MRFIARPSTRYWMESLIYTAIVTDRAPVLDDCRLGSNCRWLCHLPAAAHFATHRCSGRNGIIKSESRRYDVRGRFSYDDSLE